MSYVALATDRFDAMLVFYERGLGFSAESSWDRPNGRGVRLTAHGLRLELLDNARLKTPFPLSDPGGRFHLVLEVGDIAAAHAAVLVDKGLVKDVSWGAKIFELKDPDGVTITFIEWRS